MSLSVTISNLEQTSFTASVTTTGSVAMQHNWYLGNDDVPYTTIQKEVGQTTSSCSFSGLSAGTNYTVKVRVFAYNPWRELDNGSTSVTTKSSDSGGGDSGGGGGDTKQRPSNWYWESNIAAGASLSLPATEWNDFIKRIGEFASYKGMTLDSGYLSSAAASPGGKMRASQGNAAKYLIDQLSPPTPTPDIVSPGDTIKASFFLGLRGALNSIS